jgi:acetyl-CoA carboxylase carboxyl transferase subunit alpha
MQYLDFEQTLMEIDNRIESLKLNQSTRGIDVAAELERLTAKREKVLVQAYKKLTPWQKANIARHENRPHTLDYINTVFTDFCVLSGDRNFAEDKAIIGGFAKLKGRTVMVIGHEKGNDTESRLEHNFGMAKPEGYRKAIRLMKLAEQFGVPVITLVDTAGAFPGLEGEERGQGQAIATSTEACLDLRVPLISCIIGEGGSGGAIALASGNSVIMLEHSIYSVISPEGCASILWKDFKFAPKAAEILNLTAQDLLRLGIIDEIVPEPLGGAHRFPTETMSAVADVLDKHLDKWIGFKPDELVRCRHDKFLDMTRLLNVER